MQFLNETEPASENGAGSEDTERLNDLPSEPVSHWKSFDLVEGVALKKPVPFSG